MKLTISYLRRAAACGLRAAGAYDGDRLVGYAFGATGGGPVTRRIFVETDPENAYVVNVFVHKDYRGQRIAPALVRFGDYLLHQEGIEKGVGYVSISNLASRRSSSVTNSKVVGYAGYIELGGLFCPFRSPGARKANFRFLKRGGLIE